MKAIVYTEYGPPDVLRLTEVEKPVPKDAEVLIRIRAASVNALDWRLVRGKPVFARLMIGGLRKPKITRAGVDVAGQVEAVGSGVTQFKPGDEVFGTCRGAYAEYVCTTEDRLALKPANVLFEHAAAVPIAGFTALQGLRDRGRIQPGQKVLIDGASGGVGTFAVQIAKAFGAQVTAVCSTQNVDTARSMGADHVIDYTREDFTRSGQRYDLILAANAHRSIFDYRRALKPEGIYAMAGGGGMQMLQGLFLGPLLSLVGRKKMGSVMAKQNKKDLLVLQELLATGKIVPVIDRRFALSEVADAIGYVEKGHAKGKVVITMQDHSEKVDIAHTQNLLLPTASIDAQDEETLNRPTTVILALALGVMSGHACATNQPQMVFMTPTTNGEGVPSPGNTGYEVAIMNLDGSQFRQLTNDGKFKFLPHFSPDASKVIYAKFSVGGYGSPEAAFDVAVYDLASGQETLITHDGHDINGVWSPDGTQVAYLATAFVPAESVHDSTIWIVDADGSNPRKVASASGAADDLTWGDLAWSSQDWLLFSVAQNVNGCFKVRLDKVRPDGTQRTQVTDGGPNCTPPGMEQSGDADPGFSADGETIYSSRGFPVPPAGQIAPTTERKLYAFSSNAWSPGKVEQDLSLPAEPSCIEGVPKGSPDGTRVLLFRFCFDTGTPKGGIYVTDTAGSYRTFIAQGFGPDWNPAALGNANGFANFAAAATARAQLAANATACRPRPTRTPAACEPAFSNPTPVTITGYAGDAMEPFISKDGQFLFFNSRNDPSINTDIFYAARVDDRTFTFLGPVAGANSQVLDAVSSLDALGNFYFVSTRSYSTTLSTIYSGQFSAGAIGNVALVSGISLLQTGAVNFDAEISADGQTLWFDDGQYSSSGDLLAASLVVADRQGSTFVRRANSATILATVNASGFNYAPSISVDGLELFFTRYELTTPGALPAIYRAWRTNTNLPFGAPALVTAATGYVEAPSLSADGHLLYFHKWVDGKFVVYCLRR